MMFHLSFQPLSNRGVENYGIQCLVFDSFLWRFSYVTFMSLCEKQPPIINVSTFGLHGFDFFLNKM